VKHLYIIRFCARPDPNSLNFEEFGGAFINAFIDAPTESDAIAIAQYKILKSGWIIESVDEISFQCRDDYADDDEGLKYFEQALIEKEIIVEFTWPIDPQEGEIIN